MTIEHKNILDPNLHEPKGAAAATANKTLVSNGSGGTSWKTIQTSGVYDYDNTLTPITLTPTGTNIKILNNGLGSFTNTTYKLPLVDNIWDTTTNQFDLSGLNLGDVVTIRVDYNVTTTSANTVIACFIDLGVGGSPYTLSMHRETFKTAGTYNNITFTFILYIGDTNTRDNPGEILFSSDSGSSSLDLNGFAINVSKRNPVYV